MKIENRLQNLIPPQAVQKKPAVTQPESAQNTKQAGDAFSLKLSAAVERMQETPEEDAIRKARVEAIRNQLASGTYNISGKDVANKILKALKG